MRDFSQTKKLFHLPEGMVYLDGNSLGAMPISASRRVQHMMEHEWATQLIKGWNTANWYTQPNTVGDRLASLIGAAQGTIVMGDTLSIKVHQALAAALAINSDRHVILSDTGNFPTDLYIATGVMTMMGDRHSLKTPAPEAIEDHIDESVAALLLTQVDYRTGRMHNMERITRKAHEHGVITVWDLAHSAGAISVDLASANADFAVGCTYKYLNGGPGSPAFIYTAPKFTDTAPVALSGWMGHEKPFEFDLDFKPACGISRMRIGTPPVIALAALEASLDVWDMVNMEDVRAQSIQLTETFIREVEARCPELVLVSPRDSAMRGSQVSFAAENGYAIMQALIAHNVIGDFRKPNIIRFGFTPLYIDEGDVIKAASILQKIIDERLWDTPEFKAVKAVT